MPLKNSTEHLQHMAKLLNLSIDPDWYDSINNHFMALEKAAEQIMHLDLPPHTESALIYQLPSPSIKKF